MEGKIVAHVSSGYGPNVINVALFEQQAKQWEVKMILPIEDLTFLFPGLRMRRRFRLRGGNSTDKYDAFKSAQAELLDNGAII